MYFERIELREGTLKVSWEYKNDVTRKSKKKSPSMRLVIQHDNKVEEVMTDFRANAIFNDRYTALIYAFCYIKEALKDGVTLEVIANHLSIITEDNYRLFEIQSLQVK